MAIWNRSSGASTDGILSTGDLATGHIAAIVDNDPAKHGTLSHGLRVGRPADLADLSPALVIVSSRAFEREILEQLDGLGIPGLSLVRLY